MSKTKRPRSPAQLANDARLRNQAIEARAAKAQPRISQNAKPISPRSRQPRAEMVSTERRRRRGNTLNRMTGFKLDIFEEKQLDKANYIYRWITDDGPRLRQAYNSDYDFVNGDEIKDFNASLETDSESDGRIRMLTGRDKFGNPEYQYFMKKPLEFWEEDNRAGQDFRDDVLAGRVYGGQVDGSAPILDADGKIQSVQPKNGADSSQVYVPREAHLEHGITGRRRGPIQP